MSNGAAKDFAIVIGINQYTSLPPLRSAVGDAIEFTKWLREEAGLDGEGQIIPVFGDTFMTPWGQAKPDTSTIDTALDQLGIRKKPEIGNRLYFYFSGHGFTNDASDVGMIMANAAHDYLSRSVSMMGCKNLFRKIGYFKEVVFILDCCREQSPYSDVPSKPAVSIPALVNKFNLNGIVPEVKDLYVLATGYGGLAFAPKDGDERRGLLTKALLEGLRTDVAANEDGTVTAASLREYIEDRIKVLAAGMAPPASQEAEVDDSNSGGMILAVRPVSVIDVHIKIDKSIKSELILFEKEQKVFTAAEVAANGSVWKLKLRKRKAPYFFGSTNPEKTERVNLADAEEDKVYEFSFPRS